MTEHHINVHNVLSLLGLDAGERVYCQIVKRNITALNCLQTQGQSECFACNATSRVCELCKQRQVAIAETGMCGVCLTMEVKKETNAKMPEFPLGTRVFCIISSIKKEINVGTCIRMQGSDECRGCGVPSRVCEECRKRPSRFPRSGMCITCTVSVFGSDWQALTDEELEMALAEKQSSDEPFLLMEDADGKQQNGWEYSNEKAAFVRQSAEMPYEATMSDKETHMAGSVLRQVFEPIADQDGQPPLEIVERIREFLLTTGRGSATLIRQNLNIPQETAQAVLDQLYNEGMFMRGKIYNQYIVADQDGKITKDSLLAEAEAVIRKHMMVTVPFVQDYFKIGISRAKKILQTLEEQGVVGPTRYGVGRQVLSPIIRTETTLIEPVISDNLGIEGHEQPKQMHPLFNAAQQAIVSTGRARIKTLREQLHISFYEATILMKELEAAGIISPLTKGHRREILVSVLSQDNSLADQKAGIERLLVVIGEDGEYGRLLRSVLKTLEESAELKKYKAFVDGVKEQIKQI